MRLGNVYTETLPGNRVRIYAEATYESLIDSECSDIFYFEFPIEVKDCLSMSGDPWLVLFLPISVALGERLQINRPVDQILLEGCLELLKIWHCWKPYLPVIEIDAEISTTLEPNRNKTGAYFSGGVDSMHTVLRHQEASNKIGIEVVDELITISDIFWNDKEHTKSKELGLMNDRMSVFSDQSKKNLINVSNNIWETRFNLTDSLDYSLGCLLASTALAIGKRYSKVLIPGSKTYKEGLNGSHPLTDRLYSTSTTKFVSDGCDFCRYQKIAYLVEKNFDLSNLQVCSRDINFGNCSVCFKCIRSMLVLELLNKLEECNLFNPPILDFHQVSRVYCSTSHLLFDLELIVEEARKRERYDILETVETIFARSQWIDSSRRVIEKLVAGENLTPCDIEIISEILGLREDIACSEETRDSLNEVLNEKIKLRNYLLLSIESPNNAQLNENLIHKSYFHKLEHALLRSSLCASALDTELNELSSEFSKPEVIYVQGKPYFVTN